PVSDARVPVLKFEFRTVAIDLIFARLAVEELPARLSLTSNECLRNTDKKSTMSLNGCRVTDAILASVPNVAVFRGALRAMKLWAKRRGISSNALGYFGGVNVAIITAFVAKNFPVKCKTSAALLLKVFQIMAVWKWPEPITLIEQTEDDQLRMPTFRFDMRKDKMPIITPAYPAYNSTDKVTEQTLKIMTREFAIAYQATRSVFAQGIQILRNPSASTDSGVSAPPAKRQAEGEGEGGVTLVKTETPPAAEVTLSPDLWKSVFAPIDFFSRY
ncbi:poly(A) polymerase, partial [Kipferlia bialata]